MNKRFRRKVYLQREKENLERKKLENEEHFDLKSIDKVQKQIEKLDRKIRAKLDRDINEPEKRKKTFDKIRFPSQGKSIDNHLIDKLLDKKKDEIR